MTRPLYVAFLWHMHQPYYLNTLTGEMRLPWVRLHAAKDYLHMVEVLRPFPQLQQTFNVVPSLAEQLELYARGSVSDRFLRLSRRPAEALTRDEKAFIARNFFHVHDKIIRLYPRYLELWERSRDPDAAVEHFAVADWRDTQVWFNLAWTDPNYLENDPALARLVERGRDFSPEDVATVLDHQLAILAAVLPAYRAAAEAGQLELATSPYFHPILPLLVDTDSARLASPELPLPAERFAHPEDAIEQLRLAEVAHRARFGAPPGGLWPSEGAVGEAVVRLVDRRFDFPWIASDEGILAASLDRPIERDDYGHVLNPELLYRPYQLLDSRTALVFRDQVLSDRIGFVYQHWPGEAAAADLVGRLRRIRERAEEVGATQASPLLVSLILDGENCWETYEHNGDVFLRALYRELSRAEDLVCVSIGEFLRRFPARAPLPALATGSWINRNLETWIGEPDQNAAWDLLSRTRRALLERQAEDPLLDPATLEAAWRELYIAEGSDWFWWYHSRNDPGWPNAFDAEFRDHLASVFRALGQPPPAWLRSPIRGVREAPAAAGRARLILQHQAGGVMQVSGQLLRRLVAWRDATLDHFEIELNDRPELYQLTIFLGAAPGEPALPEDGAPEPHYAYALTSGPGEGAAALRHAGGDGVWHPIPTAVQARYGRRRVTLAVPLADLGLEFGEDRPILCTIALNGRVLDHLPDEANVNPHLIEASQG